MTPEQLRSLIEDHIQNAVDAVNNGPDWWETQYDSAGSKPKTEIELLIDNIMAEVEDYAFSRYLDGLHDAIDSELS